MEVTWPTLLVFIIISIVTVLKWLLDFKIAPFLVSKLSWLPVRNYFRSKPISISGKWDQVWKSAGSKNFKKDIDRHGHPNVKQIGSYCYAEFISKDVTYAIFGRIINDYFVGDWYDKDDPNGYFGTFHLQIKDSTKMKGRWIGHSKTEHKVKGDEWIWKKI